MRVSINGSLLAMPYFENPVDYTLWILDRALDAVWQAPGPFNKSAYFALRNASYHVQGKHDLCRESIGSALSRIYAVKWRSKRTWSTGYLGGCVFGSEDEAVNCAREADGDCDYEHYIQQQSPVGVIVSEFWPDGRPL